jgi:protein phosphatase
MTREQAANHPSKNVISRALGADESVEVDMKVIEVEEGTEFLLCSDGITRHVSDGEIRQLLIAHDDMSEICSELKRRCYERGAEDNLTVVVVRAGERINRESRFNELDPTISPETEQIAALTADLPPIVSQKDSGEYKLVPPSRTAFPGTMNIPTAAETPRPNSEERPIKVVEGNPPRSGSALVRLFGLIVFIAAVAGAFYAGTRYKGRIPFLRPSGEPAAQVSPNPVPTEDAFVKFEKARREVDRAPAEWLTGQMQKELASQGIQAPLESTNPEFLYLYGRASLLSGNLEEAAKAFEAAIAKADVDPSGANATIRKEATIGLAALTLKTNTNRENALKRYDEMMTKPAPVSSP